MVDKFNNKDFTTRHDRFLTTERRKLSNTTKIRQEEILKFDPFKEFRIV